jgi:hypothetical protein
MTTSGSGHQQSIGADSDQAVDGSAGTHAGTQEPSGAHVDAGGGRPDAGAPPVASGKTPQPGPGISDGRGVGQPSAVSGAIGPASKTRGWHARRRGDLVCYAGYNGSLVRGGEIVGVVLGCGALSASAN